MLYLFLDGKDSFAGGGVDGVEELKLDEDVTHVLCPEVTRVQLQHTGVVAGLLESLGADL